MTLHINLVVNCKMLLKTPHARRNNRKLTLHAPVINTCFSDKSYSVDRNPLPEYHIFSHRVRFHFAFHLNVEYLESLTSCDKMQNLS